MNRTIDQERYVTGALSCRTATMPTEYARMKHGYWKANACALNDSYREYRCVLSPVRKYKM